MSGNVLNLPLRQPAVLARAMASLDRLSGGRAELGIGTGGFFDAMATMGAPLLTPAEAVSGLDEALDIIRGIWDVTDPSPLRVEGKHHRVSGAARGPAPAHEIPIWVGAYKPRMQRILGRKGDGWLPSLPWLKPGDIERGNIRKRVERARRASTGTVARSVARTFADDPIPDALATRAMMPGDRGYDRYTSGYFRGARPGLVIRPESPAELQEAVRLAARHRDLPLGLFSGGHGLSGRSLNNGGIVIALDALNGIEIGDGNRVRVEPGARWGEVAKALSPHGLAITAGDYGGVGVGGLATAGGIGWLARERGLTIDHLRSVDIVTADGELVHASATENSDLFWAVRGAGANFGVAVSFEFEAHPVAERVGFAMLVFVPDDLTAFLEAWGTTIENADPTVTGTIMIGPSGPGAQTAVQALIVVDEHDPAAVQERLRPFARLAPLANQSVQMVPYAALLELPAGGEQQHGHGEPHGHSGLVRHIDHAVAVKLTELLSSRSSFVLSIRSAGGAVGHVSSDATAYAWRDANFLIAMLSDGTGEVERRWADLVPALEGMYLSFETGTGPEVLARAFPPAHLTRLRRLKSKWDPTGLFRDNFPIAPEPARV